MLLSDQLLLTDAAGHVVRAFEANADYMKVICLTCSEGSSLIEA